MEHCNSAPLSLIELGTILAARNLFPPPRPRGVCQSQTLVLRKAPGSSHGLSNATKVTVPHTKGEGGLRFFVFFRQFSRIEKAIYRPKDFILEIGLGRIKRVESDHVTSRQITSDFWTLYQDFFSRGYHAASRSPRKSFIEASRCSDEYYEQGRTLVWRTFV